MKKLTKILLVLAFFSNLSSSKPVQAVDFGLTPSTVYGIWNNINNAVLAYAKEYSTDEKWIRSLENMQQSTFTNKVPANVLEQVKQFNIKLDELRQDNKAHSKKWLLEGDLSILLASIENNRVTPSLVYLHSGQALINIVEEIVHISPISVDINPFFDETSFSDKTPSDVYSLADLGVRYLDKIIAQQKNSNLTITNGSK